MSDLVGYQYVVLRCVPRVQREEFVNVGLVVYAQRADFLASVHHVDPDRLRALDRDVDVASVEAVLATVGDVCRGVTGGGRPDLGGLGKRFGWLSAPRSTVVQPGPVHGGMTRDPGATLLLLRDRLVG